MNENEYIFQIKDARFDRYYGICCEESLYCINKKISKSPLAIYRKFPDGMKISKKYIKELHKREKFVLTLVNRELLCEESNVEDKLAERVVPSLIISCPTPYFSRGCLLLYCFRFAV